jgi:serine/threonine protein kinase
MPHPPYFKCPTLQTSNLTSLFSLSCQVCDGMLYLSHTGFVHRDLATRNIFVRTRTHVHTQSYARSRVLMRTCIRPFPNSRDAHSWVAIISHGLFLSIFLRIEGCSFGSNSRDAHGCNLFIRVFHLLFRVAHHSIPALFPKASNPTRFPIWPSMHGGWWVLCATTGFGHVTSTSCTFSSCLTASNH